MNVSFEAAPYTLAGAFVLGLSLGIFTTLRVMRAVMTADRRFRQRPSPERVSRDDEE